MDKVDITQIKENLDLTQLNQPLDSRSPEE